jgi:hypothetical protein
MLPRIDSRMTAGKIPVLDKGLDDSATTWRSCSERKKAQRTAVALGEI